MDSSLPSDSTVIHRGKALFLEARLLGGAPWGFQLKGGLEHGEELIISKVEGGGKADLLEHPLLPGDQVVVINDVELSGFRQEAISLVKGSYKTLRLTVRRECCPGPCCGEPTPLTLPSIGPPSDRHGPPRETRGGCSGGVKLRIKNSRSEPVSRPHSWHSTKLGEGQPDPSMMQISQGTIDPPWHHTYHSSASTTDLSGYDPGYLRKSPDQYSSRGSMESLGEQHSHPAYSSSCHQLSASKSSNSMDHLHSKRDSAYSSFSTSSSIPEYLAAAPTFSKERSYSMETVPQRGGVSGGGGGAVAEGRQHADIQYVRTIYDPQQGGAQEHEVSSAALLRNHEASRVGSRSGGRASCHRGSSSSCNSSGGSNGGSNHGNNPKRHSVGPIWGQSQSASCSSYESLKGAPAPPMRSDSYAAIRHHERPNSWSSLEQARSLRVLHKGSTSSCHHSSGSVASGLGKGSYGAEGQLHTVIEKSPESSPTTKPKQGMGQGFLQPPQPQNTSGCLMLPTPEPHYAQMPTSSPSPSPNPSPSSVYPALARESSLSRQRELQGLGLGVSVDTGMAVALENTSYVTSSNQPQHHDFAQPPLKQPAYPAQPVDRGGDRGHEETQTKLGLYRSHVKGEGQTVSRRQSQQGQGQRQGHGQGQAYRPSSAQSIGQERRDPYTPVQPRGERSPRYSQGSESYTENHQQGQVRHSEHSHPDSQLPTTMPSKISKGHVPQGIRSSSTPAQGPDHRVNNQRSRSPLRHYSDPSPPHHQRNQRGPEHPLTRLENALAEVQRCASPESSATSRSSHQRSPSVLEKVNRFESREQEQGKQRSQSTSASHNNLGPSSSRPTQRQHHERAMSHGAGMDDLRNMLERSSSPSSTCRTRSSSSSSRHGKATVAHQGHHYAEQQMPGSCDQAKPQTSRDPHHQPNPQDPHPGSALQRSRSTFQLGSQEESDRDRDREFHWRDGLQDLLGTIQDTSFNRAYRDCIKDAQSKVLRSTSFRRRDLGISASSIQSSNNPPPGVNNNPPPVPAKRKAVAPSPSLKPSTVTTTVPASAPATSLSPHTPKERHTITTPDPVPAPTTSPSPHTPRERQLVTPEPERFSPPELPSVQALGPPVPARIGGRKRFTMEQKKRSYSEPENMHEVGLESDARRSTQHQQILFPGTETSVADRRRMFEKAASRSLSSSSQTPQGLHISQTPQGLQGSQAGLAVSRPELRQLQQDALADYMERKRGWRTDRDSSEGRQHRHRPHSAYLHPFTDTQSVSSTSTTSLASLQELLGPDSSLFGEERLCSTLPPGLQLQGCVYPGRVTAPHIHAQAPTSVSTSHQYPTGSGSHRPLEGEPAPGQAYEAFQSQGFSQRGDGAFERAAPARSSGKSSSAEDLLEHSEEKPAPQHFRSRSSPSVERINQDFMAGGDPRMFEVFSNEPQLFTHHDNNRSMDKQRSKRPISASQSQHADTHYLLNQGPSQSNTPVMRRERQRNTDRQRALSASGLAASVGLPCPFSSMGSSPGTSLDWQVSERLSQANLDAIVFPCQLQVGTPRAVSPETRRSPTAHQCQDQGLQTRTRLGLSDTSTSEETLKDFPRENPSTAPKTTPPPVLPKTIPPLVLPKTIPPLVLPKTIPPPVLPKTTAPPPKTSPTPPSPKTSPRPHPLLSLRISESNLQETPPLHIAPPTQVVCLQDYDEVFLQDLAPPSPPPPPLPIRETDITEDFPPPPLLPSSSPPDGAEQEENRRPGLRHLNSCEFLEVVCPERRPSIPSLSPQTVPPSIPQPETPTHQTPITPSSSIPDLQQVPSGKESLGLEYRLLARRERSAGELKVEALVRQLVSRGDKTLSPVLDTWPGGGRTSTMDLMEEIFPAGGGRLPWQRRRSSTWLEDRRQDGVCSTGPSLLQKTEGERGMETDLDEEEEEADLNQKKVELLQALTLSVASLREEREVLGEEQRRFRALGGHMESLVQEHCKPNEKEKYRMFIGDLDKIVNLLMSLCGRLARVHNALYALDREEETEDSAEERESLQQKRSQLCSQHEDARELKENLDRRERVVLDILGGYLTGPQLRDYQHYVCMRPALLIRQRHLDELIKQGDEQLNRLMESISPGESDHQGPPGHQQAQFCSTNPGLGPRGASPDLGPNHGVRSTTVTSL
ncbi:protein Shroom3 [Coregonus clupeaformis]|uniref:protein Shroom3 n=1 Tax=Coregonus clupeaformis TaxID=59861 RepID=UPI001E1C7146|nr:protein Shroom3 [Coregonus clupeaformis]